MSTKHHFPAPLHSLGATANSNEFLVGGGGGKSKTGIANLLALCTIKPAPSGGISLRVQDQPPPEDSVHGLHTTIGGASSPSALRVGCAVGTKIAMFSWSKENELVCDKDADAGDRTTKVCFSPSGELVAVGCENGNVKVFAVPSLEPAGEFLGVETQGKGKPPSVKFVAFNKNNTLVACACESSMVMLYDIKSKESTKITDPARRFRGCVFTSDGNRLITLTNSNTQGKGCSVSTWDIQTKTQDKNTHVSSHSATTFAANADISLVGVGDANGGVNVVDVNSLRVVFRVPSAHTWVVTDIMFARWEPEKQTPKAKTDENSKEDGKDKAVANTKDTDVVKQWAVVSVSVDNSCSVSVVVPRSSNSQIWLFLLVLLLVLLWFFVLSK